MELTYYGHSCFSLKTKAGTVLFDPYESGTLGLTLPKLEADIVCVSHDHADHNAVSAIGGNPLVLDWPGEFEKNDIRVRGFYTFHDKAQGAERGGNIMFEVSWNGIHLLHAGDLGDMPSAEVLSEVDTTHVLMVPVGGHFTINAEEAIKLIKKIQPSIVIPMHYKSEKHTGVVAEKLADVSEFLKHMGADDAQEVEKLVLKKEELNAETTRVVLMKSMIK